MMKPRIRVCHIASGDLWAGAEVQISSLLRGLTGFPDLEVSAVVFKRESLYGELVGMGLPVTVYDEGQLSSLEILRALRGCLRSWHPDVVHTHRYKENILGCIAARQAAVPVVLQTVHGLNEHLSGWLAVKVAIYSTVNRLVTKQVADGIIGVSKEIARVTKARFPGLQVTCVHNGIDFSTVRTSMSSEVLRKELDISKDTIIVGTVSRLMPVKGIETLLRGASLAWKGKSAESRKLLIVGDGPLRKHLETAAANFGLSEQTVFLGARHDVYNLMTLFDIFVLSSLHEGIPMALLEAMALGRPVIASCVGGIPEVVRQGVDGILVPPGNHEALAQAINELERSAEERERLGRAAKARIARDFDLTHTASQVRELYLSALAEKGLA